MNGFERFGQERPLATAEEVFATESAIGRPLPVPLREMLMTVRNGDRVRANQLRTHREIGVDTFLRAGLDGEATIAKRCEELGNELPSWFMPFADCDGGNLLGMDGRGRIYFWDHEEPDLSQAVALVAPSLSALEDDVRAVVVPPENVSYTGWVNPDFAETLKRLQQES